MLEVAIAGAGPAGIAAAMALVRADPSLRGRIVVFDRAHFPRDKPCGGGLTGHAEEAMAALGLELTVPYFASPRAVVRFGSYQRDVALGRPVRVVRREEFDASLVAQARDHGVEVRQGVGVEAFEVERDGIALSVGGERLMAQVLVGADGVGSTVRKHLCPRPGAPIRLFRAELSCVESPYGDAMLYDFSPMVDGLRGYLWIFPVPGGRLNVGLMHAPGSRLSGARLTELLAVHLRRHGLELEQRARGWPAWGYHGSAVVAGPRLLTVGDAAGIDGLTGEGIAVGFEHGPIAAEQILAALSSGNFRFGGYARALRRATVGRELALDRWLARMLYGDHGWERWLPLVLFDERMLELYAARVSGTLVLADHKWRLSAALVRHLIDRTARKRALAESLA